MIYAQNIMLLLTRLSRVFTHGPCSMFICSHFFFFFSFFTWVYDVSKASALLGSDGFRPPCSALLESSLRSTGICHHNQLKLSYRITDILLPKSIFPGWNGGLWKTSHTPRVIAAFPTILLFLSVLFWYPSPRKKRVPGCPATVLSFCPCFSNIDSLEPFILNAITFQLKYDVYDVYSVSREKKSFSLLIIVLQSSPCPSQHDFCILCPCVKLSIVFRTQQDERPCFHMEETRFWVLPVMGVLCF